MITSLPHKAFFAIALSKLNYDIIEFWLVYELCQNTVARLLNNESTIYIF